MLGTLRVEPKVILNELVAGNMIVRHSHVNNDAT